MGIQREHFAPKDTVICWEDKVTLKSQYDWHIFSSLGYKGLYSRRRLHRGHQFGVIVVYHSAEKEWLVSEATLL